ncbi:DUF4124 domain-containing protein [Chitinibacter sp. SCUT-21]|uniref:DUF4124 domain-containing protein n=1 Tax=Chitinibacter sp. SCUT-21 TaxID=2970891 RepID=UPI0035A61A64
MKLTLCIALFALCSSASAAMYKCQQNGATTFQDQPCNKGAQQSSLGLKTASTAGFNPNEVQQRPTPPTEALYQQLIGVWCEDPARSYEVMGAMMSKLSGKPQPSYQQMLQELKQKDPAGYAEAMNTPPRMVVDVLPKHQAIAGSGGKIVDVVLSNEGFVIGSEGLTIYRHGQHFYRGSHEYYRIPLMRCITK